MKWFFIPQKAGETTRNPIIGEFFSNNAIDSPADALVREGIQNALDAKCENEIRVRILLATDDDSLDSAYVYRWFHGARLHLDAHGNGLREVPTDKDPCPFLVFEDFGTTGLQGDERQAFEALGVDNPFFYFFRAEGVSGKGEGDRGRWGIGKHVFPRSSRVNAYFGLTVRSDDGKRLLMGRTILKSHKLGSENFTPDGYMGDPDPEGDSMFMLPISDPKVIAGFCDDFCISRGDQAGLSVVVPYVDPNITIQDLRKAVISGYFYPILKGELAVDIETMDKKITIDATSLLSETAFLDENAKKELIPLVGLTEWALFRSAGKEYLLNACILEAPVWSDDLIPAELLDKMRKDFDGGRNLAVHVGVTVHKKDEDPDLSYFAVYLCQDGYEGGHPIFIREGITISDNRSPRSRGVRSIVIVEDKPLATLLGDAENPAHTQWQKNSEKLNYQYFGGKNHIEFVTKIVSHLVNALGVKEMQEDPYLLLDVFSLPADVVEDQPPAPVDDPQKYKGTRSKKTTVVVKSHEKPFLISRLQGGFKIGPNIVPVKPPLRLDIQVGYDLRRGNPVKHYHPSDFELDKAPIGYQESLKGLSVFSVENNHMVVDILKPDFNLVVVGFDEKRDLFVKADVLEI